MVQSLSKTYEEQMKECLAGLGLKFETEFKFCPSRRWRFDFVIKQLNIAIEVEGLVGRHRSIGGFLGDMRKYNAATIYGWRLIRTTRSELGSVVGRKRIRTLIESLMGSVSPDIAVDVLKITKKKKL